MAFGDGALLAALTIDLVASTLAKGYFTPLAIGCIIGGVLFVLLNEVVNDYGGFVRKASTTFFHLNRPNMSRSLRIFSSIHRTDVLQGLPNRDYHALSFSMTLRSYHKGTLIQRVVILLMSYISKVPSGCGGDAPNNRIVADYS